MPASIRFRRRLLAARLPYAAPGQRIGLLGGSFNPPHSAHLAISETALKRLGLDRVWWLVSPGNPLKSHAGLAPTAERLALARRIARDPRIVVTDVEEALGSPYTADIVDFLTGRHPQARFVWIMGADNMASFHRWRDWRAIARLLPIAVIDRPGWALRALASPMARAFARYRVPLSRARTLAETPPPAWVFLSQRLSPLSSTDLRKAAATPRQTVLKTP